MVCANIRKIIKIRLRMIRNLDPKKLEQILNRILQSTKPVKNLTQFFANLITSKTKQSETPTLNKTFQEISSGIQVKQVDHKQHQTTITSFQEQIPELVTRYPPTIITVGAECISQLEPGIVFDACSVMSLEDYQEIKKYGHIINKKLQNKPIYVLDTTKKEYQRKNCPKDRFEIVRDVEYTGKPRNFNDTLVELQKSLGVDVYYVETNSSELHKKARECLRKFKCHQPDNMYLAFAIVTGSDVLTLDGGVISSSKKAKVKSIDFHEFLDKIMGKAPMTIITEKRAELNKKLARPVFLYNHLSSFKRDY